MKNQKKVKNLLHLSFEIGILLKGINGIFEVIAGVCISFLNPSRLNALLNLWLANTGFWPANWLERLLQNFSLSTQHFAVFYLISHGMIKSVLVILLWRKKLFAYPLTTLILVFFIVYQMHRYTNTHSILLIFLSHFDIVMIFLTLWEYKRVQTLFRSQI